MSTPAIRGEAHLRSPVALPSTARDGAGPWVWWCGKKTSPGHPCPLPSRRVESVDDEQILFVRLGLPVEDDDRELPRRRYGWDETYTEQELRDSARAWWVLSRERAEQCRFVAAISQDRVQGVWEIVPGSWRSTDGRRFGKSPVRWGFAVRDAPLALRERLVGRPVGARSGGGPLFISGSVIAYGTA